MQSLLKRLKLAENAEKSNMKNYLLQGVKPLCIEPFLGRNSYQLWTKDNKHLHLQSISFRTFAQQLSQLFTKSKVRKRNTFFQI